MPTFKKTVVINAEPQKVWDVVSDSAGMHRWFPGISRIEMPDAPKTGVGIRRNIVVGGPAVLREVITHWEPGHLFGYSVRGGIPFLKSHQGLIKIEGRNGGSLVTYTTDIEMPLLLAPLGYLGGFGMNELIGKALVNLKNKIESGKL